MLDRVLPEFDFRERHAIRVDASPERTLSAALAVTPAEAPLLRVLFRLRGLPVRGRPVWDELRAVGLRELEPGVAAGVARPWTLGGGFRDVRDFAAFREPGFAKIAVGLRLADGLLYTETRILCTDRSARARFRVYWLVVRPFSGLVRRSWLRAAKRRAEGDQSSSSAMPS